MIKTVVDDSIYWVGINDRTTDLFEGLWPITESGITYNSYVVKGDVNVLIDLAKGFKTDEYFEQISRITDIHSLNYVIINHMEPDHTGVLRTLKKIVPEIKIICTSKAAPMLKNLYGIEDGIQTVNDGEKISFGQHYLQFIHIPFVHWPETMVTYDDLTKTLFSCDAFGGYGALEGTVFDEECVNIPYYETEALRYFSNIIAKFSTPVLNAIKKLNNLDIKIIAPSHGLVWRKYPQRIYELYKKWSEFADNGGETSITLLYGSMYGNTEMMMNAVAQGISDGGIRPEIFDVARIHASYILPSLWKNKGVAVGAPTYEVSLFPYMQQILEKAAIKNVKHKKAIYFGSYGWSKGAFKKVISMTGPLDWEMIDSLEFSGGVNNELYSKGYELGKKFAILVKKL